jgi:(S)-mandelate dehydrogenase
MFSSSPVSVADYRRLARKRLPRWVFDYLDGGAEDEQALGRNAEALADVRMAPSVLLDVSAKKTSVDLFGRAASMPMLVAPTGLNGLLWPQGDVALARAATAAGVPFCLSTASTSLIEDVAKAAPDGDLWFQLYVMEDRSIAEQLLRRARAAGFRVLVLTVDVPMGGKRERDLRNGFQVPFRFTPRLVLDCAMHPRWSVDMLRAGAPQMINLQEPGKTLSRDAQAALLSRRMDLKLSWNDLAWLRDRWPGPVVLKGVLRAADAERAAQAGVDGVVLSNHGGRQLDAAAAPIDVLPQIAGAVGDRMKVMIDSGFRRGGDIVKASALGAHAVLLGRATLYGLAAAGEQGAAAVLALLREEMDRTMTLLGCSDIGQIGAAGLCAARPRPIEILSPG